MRAASFESAEAIAVDYLDDEEGNSNENEMIECLDHGNNLVIVPRKNEDLLCRFGTTSIESKEPSKMRRKLMSRWDRRILC